MAKNKKKGVAILSALVLMTVVIIISGLLFAINTSSNLKNRKQKYNIEKYITTTKIFNDFIDNGQIDGEYTFDIEIIDNFHNAKEGIQAIVVKKINATSTIDLYYYCIYDFDNKTVLAEQSGNFYLTTQNIDNVDYYFLADLIKYKEV
jgi:hypothetical protein